MTLFYQGGYDTVEWGHALDGAPTAASPETQFIISENPRTQNHELRLASSDDKRFFWKTGVFYFIGGNDLPNAPEFTITAGIEHPWYVLQGTLVGRIFGKYQSSYYFSHFNYPDTEQEAYTTGNLSLSYTPINGSWTLQAYMLNFTDEGILAGCQAA